MTEVQLERDARQAKPELELPGRRRRGRAPHVAAPTLCFTLRAAESTAREVYMVALTTQIHIDRPPVARNRDA